jgi:hypothetical protein
MHQVSVGNTKSIWFHHEAHSSIDFDIFCGSNFAIYDGNIMINKI